MRSPVKAWQSRLNCPPPSGGVPVLLSKLTPAGSDLLARVSLLESESALVKSLSRMEAQQRQQLLDLLSQFVMHLSGDEELIAFANHCTGKSTARTSQCSRMID